MCIARFRSAGSPAIFRGLGDRRGIASGLVDLGNIAYRWRDHAAARGYRDESLTIRREQGDKGVIAEGIDQCDPLARMACDRVRGARWIVATSALRRAATLRL